MLYGTLADCLHIILFCKVMMMEGILTTDLIDFVDVFHLLMC